ncbi:MAG: Ppx/GppA family phosphatase, partial [Syntrophomonadaceae bacterium]
ILSLLAPLEQKSITPDYPLVVVGGTATTLAAMQLRLSVYDSRLIHGQSLTIDQIQYWRDHLASMSLEERQKVIGLQPQRADIIVPGIRILALIMDQLGYEEMLISESDILDGVIAQLSG